MGREITKCHGKGNLRLVFPGITGNGNSRSPLSHINEHKGLVRGSILWGIGTKCRGGCLDDGDYFLVFNQHCWLSRERGCGGSLVCHSMSSPSLSTQSTFWPGKVSIVCRIRRFWALNEKRHGLTYCLLYYCLFQTHHTILNVYLPTHQLQYTGWI